MRYEQSKIKKRAIANNIRIYLYGRWISQKKKTLLKTRKVFWLFSIVNITTFFESAF